MRQGARQAMSGRLIVTEADIDEGVAALVARAPRFADALARAGRPPLRRREDGFAALLRIMVSQQLSVAAAQTIWTRLEAAGGAEPARLVSLDDAALRACGLSAQKIRYARALAAARLDYAALHALPEADAIAALTQVVGVGRWTAEIYLMFCVGRADVFAPGDLALQEGARMLFDLPARPAPAALATMAEAWSPWRAVAARLLWAYYGAARGREGVGA